MVTPRLRVMKASPPPMKLPKLRSTLGCRLLLGRRPDQSNSRTSSCTIMFLAIVVALVYFTTVAMRTRPLIPPAIRGVLIMPAVTLS